MQAWVTKDASCNGNMTKKTTDSEALVAYRSKFQRMKALHSD